MTKQMRSFSSLRHYDAGLHASAATFAVNEPTVCREKADQKLAGLGIRRARIIVTIRDPPVLTCQPDNIRRDVARDIERNYS